MSKTPPMQVAVIGPGDRDAKRDDLAAAESLGRHLARAGATVVTGGLGGVMRAACSGARAAGGLTVGILPERGLAEANPFLSVVVPSGMGEMRNGLVVASGAFVVACGGSWGTMSEVSLALRTERYVISVNGWPLDDLDPGGCYSEVTSVEDALPIIAQRLASGWTDG